MPDFDGQAKGVDSFKCWDVFSKDNGDSLCSLETALRSRVDRCVGEVPGALAGRRGECIGVVRGTPVALPDFEERLVVELAISFRGEALDGPDNAAVLLAARPMSRERGKRKSGQVRGLKNRNTLYGLVIHLGTLLVPL